MKEAQQSHKSYRPLMTQEPVFSQLSDREIVNAILKRDREVTKHFLYIRCYPLFKSVYDNYYTDCCSCVEFINDIYIYVMTVSESTGHCKLQDFRFECSLTLWIKEVCIFYCYARYRRKKREIIGRQAYTDRLKGEQASMNIDLAQMERDDIMRLIAFMRNSRYAEIIRLFYVENKTNEEVAEILGISKANLYNKHILAKDMFAAVLRKEVSHV